MAYTDEQIAADVAWLEPVIGKTSAEWYAESHNVTPDDPGTTHGEVLWACRARMLALILGRNMKALADAAAFLADTVEYSLSHMGRVDHLPELMALAAKADAVRKAMWWRE